MAKFSRIPCKTCNEDTLHQGFVCTRCGAVYVVPSSIGYEKHKAHLAKLFLTRGKEGALLAAKKITYDRMMARKAEGMRNRDLPFGQGTHKYPGRTPGWRK